MFCSVYISLITITAGFVLTICSWLAPPLNAFVHNVRIIGLVCLGSGGGFLACSCLIGAINHGKCCSFCYRNQSKKEGAFSLREIIANPLVNTAMIVGSDTRAKSDDISTDIDDIREGIPHTRNTLFTRNSLKGGDLPIRVDAGRHNNDNNNGDLCKAMSNDGYQLLPTEEPRFMDKTECQFNKGNSPIKPHYLAPEYNHIGWNMPSSKEHFSNQVIQSHPEHTKSHTDPQWKITKTCTHGSNCSSKEGDNYPVYCHDRELSPNLSAYNLYWNDETPQNDSEYLKDLFADDNCNHMGTTLTGPRVKQSHKDTTQYYQLTALDHSELNTSKSSFASDSFSDSNLHPNIIAKAQSNGDSEGVCNKSSATAISSDKVKQILYPNDHRNENKCHRSLSFHDNQTSLLQSHDNYETSNCHGDKSLKMAASTSTPNKLFLTS